MPLPSWELTSPNDNNEVKLEGHKVVIAVLPDGEYGLPSAVTLGIFFKKKKKRKKGGAKLQLFPFVATVSV
jgi:hypothetical protein